MIHFILRRIGIAIPTLAIIATAAFFLMRAAPGGPFDAEADLEPEVLENIRAAYDLDKPLLTQYLLYVRRALGGDFGPSLIYKDFGVTELISIGLPVSVRLGLTAMALALVVGAFTGIVAALRQNRFVDHAVMALAMTGIAVPSFVTAPILALVFGLYLRWLPVAGWNDGALSNMVLPVIALSLPQIAIIARLTRGGMLEVLRSNFVRTARAKGIPESRVVLRHVLPSAVIPLVGYLGPAIAGVMTGSLVIELIFNLPGVGRYFVQGALNRDYPLVMGIVIVYASFIVLLNLLSDLAYAALDPRIRKGVPVNQSSGNVLTSAPVTAALSGQASQSLWRQAARRFRRNRAAMGSIFTLVLIGMTSILVPLLWPHGIEDANWESILAAPTLDNWHWFGTDANGRDLFVRVFYGGRVSLTIGLLTTLVALSIGVVYGSLAGFTGGRTDNLMMRFVDVLYSMPLLFFIIILVTVFGRNIYLVFVAIGCIEWLTMSRIVRGQTLAVKTREYVESAVAIGLTRGAILRRYIIPNVLGPVVVYVTLLIPTNIVVESYLSFIGLGVQEPLTSWGLLIAQGAGQLDTAPWLIFFPATFLAVTMFCFNFIGDGLRDALDPSNR